MVTGGSRQQTGSSKRRASDSNNVHVARTGDTALQDASTASVMAGQSPWLPAAQGRVLLQCPGADAGWPRAGRKLRSGGGRGKAGQMHSMLRYGGAPSAHHDGAGPGPTKSYFHFRCLKSTPSSAPLPERRPCPLPSGSEQPCTCHWARCIFLCRGIDMERANEYGYP